VRRVLPESVVPVSSSSDTGPPMDRPPLASRPRAPMQNLTCDQAGLLRDGMELLFGYLVSVRDGCGNEEAPIY